MTKLIDVTELSKLLCKFPIQCELAYATCNNFVGRLIDGYHVDAIDICLLTRRAAYALCEVQNDLINHYQMGLLVLDAYRPRRAVEDFIKWSLLPPANDFELQRKALHFPNIEKTQLFSLGYVAEDSNHCYGNTVDLVLVDLKNHLPVDMGAIFDFMDKKSHLDVNVDEIGKDAYKNRQILQKAMHKFGFEPYKYEFWHFCHGGQEGRETLTALDIEITSSLKGIQ